MGLIFLLFFENFFVPILTSGGLAAVSSSAFAALYSAFGKCNISLELVISVKLLFLFVFFGFVLTTVGTSYTAAAYIKNRLDIVGIFRSLSYIFEVLFYVVVFAFFTPEVWQG